jgi:hypothetical protein
MKPTARASSIAATVSCWLFLEPASHGQQPPSAGDDLAARGKISAEKRLKSSRRKKYEDWDSNPGFHFDPFWHKEIP